MIDVALLSVVRQKCGNIIFTYTLTSVMKIHKEMKKYNYFNVESPKGKADENEDRRTCVDDFNKMFTTTCDMLSTFKGVLGSRTVATVVSLVNETPELCQFMFELFYNTRTADRLSMIYDEK